MKTTKLVLCLLLLLSGSVTQAQIRAATKTADDFTLAANGKTAPIFASTADWPGVLRAAKDLQADVQRVTKKVPGFSTSAPVGAEVVLIGTLGKSPLIDGLVKAGKLNVAGVTGRWETFLRQVVERPLPGVARALVIAGSDKRGTIYGIYDLSQQIGVSPWYWWADVPVKPQTTLLIPAARHTLGEPAVKYRGIFINDEAPALSGWSKEKFGGVNSKMYSHLFELILRLKGNYLWPAMWGNMFNVDDPLSPELADEYGIVMGTSHHEPLTRAHEEWKAFGHGTPWNYQTNDSTLRRFWRGGMRRMGTRENIVTVGMRGDGDEPMSRASNTALLERIVADQRQIIAEETHKPADQTPQMWALYKEVQEYYDKGMRVPDDITLLLCDDNWGNIRKLPKLGDKPRRGGYGIYYHFDYVGGPRNYKWLNTNPLPRIWEQMHLAHAYGANQIWIVNVGDLKPMELPISFFLDYAWKPDAIPATGVAAYTRRWAAQQFGPAHAADIADILAKYAKYNARRKPELLSPETYSLPTGEWARVVADYNQLLTRAEAINQQLPAASRDAYYELVLHPVQACANLNELYYTVAQNREAAKNSQANTNALAEKARALYAKDAEITQRYHALAGGKWNHLMDQTHIGYTYWQQPEANKMPEVQTLSAAAPSGASPVASAFPVAEVTAKPAGPAGTGFLESNGYVSIEAEHFTKAVNAGGITWQGLPDLGRTLGAVTTFPVTAAAQATPGGASPHLEYRVTLTQPGPVTVRAYLAPTLDFTNSTGLRYAVSFDDEAPQIINLHTGLKPDNGNRPWEQAVADNIIIKASQHTVAAGPHVLKFWRVDAGVVLEKLVVHRGELPASYLGPPESAAPAAAAGKGSLGSR
ncbi:glycosyl hydrolase 115 family protein [Hymenobacter convexus]|uniref:glycosyl hydrolase 115 family protein n=1 Tax=Hymenobacter sp. CA1UV-4 TaxID=3063782 RepID=UPI002713A3C3|nr:glycosyl hydrolase 115 family protein [Hymenobacter sp. CA1UV-4]MDO7851298.1 glycosyl hydrolase 115 family protein [Hymenobacter sp. CA1UV-4]